MKIRWLQSALNDAQGIHDYIARDSVAAARRVIKAIRDELKVLPENPAIGRPGRIEGTRELIIRKYPYIVAYRQTTVSIEILAVVHSSRRWPGALNF